MPPPPEPPKVQLQERQIVMPKPKPEPKPVEMEAKVNLPTVKAKPQIVTIAPQPKAALTAAMPAQNNQVKPSTAPVHLGQTFGVTPNPNANAAGDHRGHRQSLWRHAGSGGRAAWSGGLDGHRERNPFRLQLRRGGQGSLGRHPGLKRYRHAGTLRQGRFGRDSCADPGCGCTQGGRAGQVSTDLEVLSKPPVQYTSEARQLRVQGDVVLRVTFLASGQVVVQGVVRGLGHGLDEEARRVAQQIRFRPATRNGQPVDLTTTITITFQLA